MANPKGLPVLVVGEEPLILGVDIGRDESVSVMTVRGVNADGVEVVEIIQMPPSGQMSAAVPLDMDHLRRIQVQDLPEHLFERPRAHRGRPTPENLTHAVGGRTLHDWERLQAAELKRWRKAAKRGGKL